MDFWLSEVLGQVSSDGSGCSICNSTVSAGDLSTWGSASRTFLIGCSSVSGDRSRVFLENWKVLFGSVDVVSF